MPGDLDQMDADISLSAPSSLSPSPEVIEKLSGSGSDFPPRPGWDALGEVEQAVGPGAMPLPL